MSSCTMVTVCLPSRATLRDSVRMKQPAWPYLTRCGVFLMKAAASCLVSNSLVDRTPSRPTHQRWKFVLWKGLLLMQRQPGGGPSIAVQSFGGKRSRAEGERPASGAGPGGPTREHWTADWMEGGRRQRDEGRPRAERPLRAGPGSDVAPAGV